MQTNQISPSASNTADFRKTFYDDDGDAVSLVHVKALERSGQPLTGAEQTPSWLAYTTASEATTAGPYGARSLFHLDFSVPLGDPALAQDETYLVEIAVTDGATTTTKSFPFSVSATDLDDVAPMALWISARKGTDPHTNHAPGSAVVVENVSSKPPHVPSRFHTYGAFANSTNGDATQWRRTTGPVLPTSDVSAGRSVFMLVEVDDPTKTGYLLRQTGDSLDWHIGINANRLEVVKQNEHGLLSEPLARRPLLVEWHRVGSTNDTQILVDGAVLWDTAESLAYGSGYLQIARIDSIAYTDLAVYSRVLTEAERLTVRRKYQALYPYDLEVANI